MYGAFRHATQVAGPAGHLGRRVHGLPGRLDRERGLPGHRALVPGHLRGRPVLGPERLQRGVRRAAGAGRAGRRPGRPAQDLLRGHGRVPAGLGAVRSGPERRAAGGGARAPGGGRGHPDPHVAGAAAARVPARAARHRHVDLGRHRGRGRGHRPVAGRRAGGRRQLALGVPDQHPDRPGRADPRAPDPARVPRRVPRRRARPAGRRPADGGRRPDRPGHRAGRELGLRQRPHRGRGCRRAAVPGGHGRPLAHPPCAGAGPAPVPHPFVRRGRDRADGVLGRLLRAAAGQHPVPDAGLGLPDRDRRLRRHARAR